MRTKGVGLSFGRILVCGIGMIACSGGGGANDVLDVAGEGTSGVEVPANDIHDGDGVLADALADPGGDPVSDALSSDVLSEDGAWEDVPGGPEPPEDTPISDSGDLEEALAPEAMDTPVGDGEDAGEENGCGPVDHGSSAEVSDDQGGGDVSPDPLFDVAADGPAETQDPCDPNPCTSPPRDSCDENGVTLWKYPAIGDCTAPGGVVTCDYAPMAEDCSSTGQVCQMGVCVNPIDPCQPNPCTSPPPPVCDADRFTLWTYPAMGTCTAPGGLVVCDYPPMAEDCSLSDRVCEDAACQDPCDPNPCMSPPPDSCDEDGVTLWKYPAIGDCIAPGGVVTCDYAPMAEDCSSTGQVCQDGACVPQAKACPEDMVPLTAPDGHAYCMDRYEASRADATGDSPGTSGGATSRPGVIPWYVSNMSLAVLAEFTAGCEAAGKRMCTPEEWFEACNGPDDTVYFFGNAWNPETCNSVDTFCDDWCAEKGISPCDTGENCGYQYYCFHVMPTGAFPDCTSAYGLYDVNGNVWEVVPVDTARGYQVRGGAFNCGSPSVRFRCDFDANWNQLFAGFRCCKDPE